MSEFIGLESDTKQTNTSLIEFCLCLRPKNLVFTPAPTQPSQISCHGSQKGTRLVILADPVKNPSLPSKTNTTGNQPIINPLPHRRQRSLFSQNP